MKIFCAYSIVLLFICSLPSCKQEPNGGIPFYMKMDTVILNVTAGQGANTQGIADVWVQTLSTNLGAYELPCNFPVLEQGNVSFLVQAGILVDGEYASPIPYPFYQPDTFTVLNATPGSKYTQVPKFSYKAATNFVFTEDFEHGSSFDSIQQITGLNVKYGSACGKITVSPTDSTVVALEHNAVTVHSGQEIWLEIDYKSDVPFWIGFEGYFPSGATDQQQQLFVVANETWSKLYVTLSQAISQEGASTYKIFFQPLCPSGSSGGSLYLDNIKLVQF
jgi:hypothetical protein